MKKLNDFSCKIAGAAGDGVLSAGMLFAKACMRGGLDMFATAEYPSLIRGGHNHLDVRVSDGVSSHSKNIDVLVALNQDAVDYHFSKIQKGGAIIYDELNVPQTQDVLLCPVPLKRIANENGGLIMRNTVAIGAVIGLLDFDLELFNKIIAERFGKKDSAIIAANVKAANEGYNAAKQYAANFSCALQKKAYEGNIFLTGNEAISMGAIKAGLKFYSAYPMTPASSLLSYMAANEKAYGIVVKHTEDEIAAINMAIGASYAGARAMTGTSGGGFALMVEAFGLAAMTETPLVVVEAQRPGPATGMATHSSQGDLRFVMHAGTDDFPKIVIAPGDVNECFYETIRAFNLADKYQVPVIILTDKYLGESYWSTKEFDTSNVKIDRGQLLTEYNSATPYRRYKITETGVSPRTIPGVKNGMHVASSYEHDEKGFEREEEPVRVAMHNKRMCKLEFIEKEIGDMKLDGPDNAPITIVAWGSTKGAIKEAMKILKNQGVNVNYLQFLYLYPFPARAAKQILLKSNVIVDIENNKSGQLAGVIKEHTGIDANHKILKYDGRPFTPEELVDALKKIAENKADKVMTEEYKDVKLDEVKMRTFKVMK